jgi:hypothetical protein
MSDATLGMTMKFGGTASSLIFVLVYFAPGFAASSESSSKGSAVTLSDNDLYLVTLGEFFRRTWLHRAQAVSNRINHTLTHRSGQMRDPALDAKPQTPMPMVTRPVASRQCFLATDDVLIVTGSADSIAAGQADTATRSGGLAGGARRVDVEITRGWAAARGDLLHDVEATTEGAAQGDLVFSRNFARDRTGPTYEVSRSLSHLHSK